MSTGFKNDVQLILFKADRAFTHIFVSSVDFVHNRFNVNCAFLSQFCYIFGLLLKHFLSSVCVFKVRSSSHYWGFTLRSLWLSIRNLHLNIIKIIISWFRVLNRSAFILELSVSNRLIIQFYFVFSIIFPFLLSGIKLCNQIIDIASSLLFLCIVSIF